MKSLLLLKFSFLFCIFLRHMELILFDTRDMWCMYRTNNEDKYLSINSGQYILKFFSYNISTLFGLSLILFHWLETIRLIINSHNSFIWLSIMNLADLPTHSPSSTLKKQDGGHSNFLWHLLKLKNYKTNTHWMILYFEKHLTTFAFIITHIRKF